MSNPSKVKPVTTIFVMFAFIYVTAHPECVIAFFLWGGQVIQFGML